MAFSQVRAASQELIILSFAFTPKSPKSATGLSRRLSTHVPLASFMIWRGLCSTELTLHISLLLVRGAKSMPISGLTLRWPSLFLPSVSCSLENAANLSKGSKIHIPLQREESPQGRPSSGKHTQSYFMFRGSRPPDGKGSQGREVTGLLPPMQKYFFSWSRCPLRRKRGQVTLQRFHSLYTK